MYVFKIFNEIFANILRNLFHIFEGSIDAFKILLLKMKIAFERVQ